MIMRPWSDTISSLPNSSKNRPGGLDKSEGPVKQKLFLAMGTVAGMADFMFREYSSNQQGRCISPDPAGLAAVNPTNPQSWNRYAYASNTPLTVIDPLGLYTCGNCPPIDNGPPDQSDLFESGWFIDDIGSHFEPL